MITQGIWKAKKNDDGSWVVMSGNIVIATFDRKDQPEWNESNAKLIAAAPELLTACKAAKSLILNLEQVGAVDNPEELHLLRQAVSKVDKN